MPATLSRILAEFRLASLVAWAYTFIVVLTAECPKSSCTSFDNAYADYREKIAQVEETYGTKSKSNTLYSRIQSYQRDESVQQSEYATQEKNRGAR